MSANVVPWECRDKDDQSEALYNVPLHRTNRALTQENQRLKKLLRQHNIPWSTISQTHLSTVEPGRRKTRSSNAGSEMAGLRLPTEVLLRILKFAMTSPYPILDPLSSLAQENISELERERGNQISIHFLATCSAMHTEGTKYLWECNRFVFTCPQALQNFGELNARFRHPIQSITLRVIARYYDDQRRRHKLEAGYHADLKKDQPLRVHMRPRESLLVRGGFRCYTWNQIVDFLAALRAPYDAAHRDKAKARPKLLPNLKVLRLDLVNFSDELVPFSGSELHGITSHELGCTLNELQVTGMPFDDAGMKASAELSGMLKDEGLYLDGPAAFVAHKKHLQELSGSKWCARIIRAWKSEEGEDDEMDDGHDGHDSPLTGWHRPKLGILPPAPEEKGHPTSTRLEGTVIWKRVPTSRDSDERQWTEFSRFSGYEIDSADSDSDSNLCPCCGESHPGASFLDFLMDDEDGEDDEDDGDDDEDESFDSDEEM
ncbi:uncharacterized protein BBA_05216 [Beauveria bassiana ARSEF 2860]|uniref:Uncharacterized protein n=1 Tax=Beauveria bassiana (strain ARSEF 2860) TaxID=655819 RepID=J4W666_BEAB2|nr:uncharacterized protein BBA_05216 [Beauveria bassiana ARSEF 2860]EJP65805.1 hypothetical protein BBA_05216 [Beauveria bassiana ARSEF 2860]